MNGTNVFSLTFDHVVPESFFDVHNSHCKNLDGTFRHEHEKATNMEIASTFGCHCIEENSDCRKIVQFLTLDGKFGIKRNIKTLFNDVISSFPNTFASKFSTVMEEIVYPLFSKRFSQRFQQLKNTNPEAANRSISIKNEVDCLVYGADCVVAIDRLNDTIQKLYRVFSILNKESVDHLQSIDKSGINRHLGTLLANLNFQLSDEHDVSSFQLKQDLANILRNILPNSKMSLTDMVAFLGYSDILGEMSIANLKTESSYDVTPAKCPSKKKSIKESSVITKFPKLKRIDPDIGMEGSCDLDEYMRRWNSYFKYVFHGSSNGGSNCDTGYFKNFFIFLVLT